MTLTPKLRRLLLYALREGHLVIREVPGEVPQLRLSPLLRAASQPLSLREHAPTQEDQAW